ncbi:MAG: CBS domain-containing protein [Rhodospirillales bacterium]|jgi:CBS domain-containing protein|nr:CBS domain-containing protein [Rhodospirillales bacterium]
MTCREIMNADPPVLRHTDTVGVALRKLLAERYLALPVVDDEGRYLGLFAKSRLFGLMLPSIVALEDVLPKIAHLTDLAYLSDDLEDLRARFATLRNDPVARFADREAPTLKPDSPLMEAVLLVFRTRNFVPVVEPLSGRLAGMVSTWEILDKLEESL